MTCKACANPIGGVYVIGCRPCALREIARGPEFFASRKACKITPAYAALLQTLGPVKDVNEEVKAMAETIHAAAVKAAGPKA